MGNYSSGIANHNQIFVNYLRNHPEVQEITVVKFPVPEKGVMAPLLQEIGGVHYYVPRLSMDYHGAFESILQADSKFIERLKVRFLKLALKCKQIKRFESDKIRRWGKVEWGLLGIAVVEKPFPNPIQKQIGHCIAKLHPDIIQSHTELFTIAGSVAKDVAKAHISYQVLVEEEKEYLPPHSLPWAIWDRMADALKWLIENKTVDLYLASSEYVKRQLYNRGFSSEKIEILYSPLIVKQLTPLSKSEARSRLGIPQNKRVILSLGRVVERKRIIDIIQVLKDLPEDVIFYFKQSVSNSDEVFPSAINKIKKEIKKNKLENRVIINPEILPYDQMKIIYSAADLAVYPFLYEPFGMCATEAMAARLPLIVYNSGYLPEFIKGNGFVIEPLDLTDLRDKIKVLLDDPSLANDMGSKGPNLVKKFDIHVLGEKLMNIYREFL